MFLIKWTCQKLDLDTKWSGCEVWRCCGGSFTETPSMFPSMATLTRVLMTVMINYASIKPSVQPYFAAGCGGSSQTKVALSQAMSANYSLVIQRQLVSFDAQEKWSFQIPELLIQSLKLNPTTMQRKLILATCISDLLSIIIAQDQRWGLGCRLSGKSRSSRAISTPSSPQAWITIDAF